ncbi:hypothetical protein [Levilactobacillus spicheri]|uniref:Uncharacterized protein n=2 Tax=Levilactobacillus spicheri TaxID=216463 RepID=A0ABQ0WL95_9LACO|nr:hypothetical protein [Levilactobacillus spicheri]KRL49285.1 hypothetical protein FD37_GL000884 [Levilactobacillus spicheri DSM 15429]GEO65713.1 hypothetical protein LSP04_01320 [Levilactobacillus spicheri]
MVTHLRGAERDIVNQLIDRNLFTSTLTAQTPKATVNAVKALKKTVVQQHVNHFLQELVGTIPENYQENLVWLVGPPKEDAETVHILLATLKAVINVPELQGNRADRSVLTQTIVRQVHSEVPQLDEREIHRRITQLFVDRFQLFTPDTPEYVPLDQDQEVIEYWNVDPDFNRIAQALVTRLATKAATPPLTRLQRLNRALLIKRSLSRATTSPQLWQTLQEHRTELAQQWAELGRFDLECGDDYALLLDRTRTPSRAKPTVVAIAVARQIGEVGLPAAKLMAKIKQVTAVLFPDATISPTLVKQALAELGLVTVRDTFVVATPIAQRFLAKTTPEEESHHE